MSRFKYSVGPWNVHEGADAYGPATRATIPFEEKIKTFKFYNHMYIYLHRLKNQQSLLINLPLYNKQNLY